MGGLLSLVSAQTYEEYDITLSGDSRPGPSEEKVFARVQESLSKIPHNMKLIEDYTGCQELARKAMSSPSPENERAAFEGLLGAVESISSFFNFTKELEAVVPDLLTTMASAPPTDGGSHLIPEALGYQLAQIMEFALEFDRVRMLRPNLSNDFSYYRRLLPKFNKHPNLRIKDDEASGMALFTAEHIPMMNCLCKATARAQEKNAQVGRVLAIMANSCRRAIANKRFSQASTNMTCARAMTAAIVISDHIDIFSVFNKKSPVAVKACILTLKKDFPKEVSLLNAIRYSTRHFNEAPPAIQDLFD
jgi:hypothetical protein